MKKAVRNLIIGRNTYIESWNEFQQVMLSGQYALISLGLLAMYMVMEFPSPHPEALLTYLVAFVIIVVSIVLHRHQLHCPANYALFSTLNILLFLIASSESLYTAAAVFFIPMALGTFSVFNYSQRIIALCFSLASMSLLLLIMTHPFTFLPFRKYSEPYILFNQAFNIATALVVSVMAIYLLISINHRNARQLVMANKQLTKLNDELDRFVYSTSHDLRAPLLSVKGLLRLTQTANADEKNKYHGLMEKRIDNLDKFIKDITDYSRNSRLQIVKENINVFELAEEIWESLRFGETARGIEFKNELPKNLEVVNDGKRIKIVLSNLISNAIYYHDQRKEQKYIRLYHQFMGSSFSLHLEDNGQGIAPELQTRIFEMFFRGNETSQGSGLGLYIVQETLVKLSGNIHLKSVQSKGSTFSITLPVHYQ